MGVKQKKLIKKELLRVERQEQVLRREALSAKPPAWKTALEQKVPEKIRAGLESGFRKGFTIVFANGRTIIEKSYRKEELKANYAVHDYAMQMKGGRKEWRQLRREAKQTDWLNLAATTAEGVGLGVLGIGLPDIVLFLGMLLRGIYETALHYGFDYEDRWEQLLILKMMATALSTGEEWEHHHSELDALLKEEAFCGPDRPNRFGFCGGAAGAEVCPGAAGCGDFGRCSKPGVLRPGVEVCSLPI